MKLKLIIATIGALILLLLTLFALVYFKIIPLPQFFQNQSKLLPKAQAEMPSFITNSLKPGLFPPSLEIKQLKNSLFITSWNLSKGEVLTASARYDNQMIVQDRNITIISPQVTQFATNSASTIASQYISIKTGGVWKCDQSNTNMNICENFWTDGQKVKHGIGVMSPISSSFPKTSIFYCEFYPQSQNYSWKSCNLNKAKTGWD